MRKGVDAIATVVGTGAGIAYPAKGRVGGGGVHYGVVYGYAAGVGRREDLRGACLLDIVLTSQINKQRGDGMRRTLVDFGLVGAEDVEAEGVLAFGS